MFLIYCLQVDVFPARDSPGKARLANIDSFDVQACAASIELFIMSNTGCCAE